MAIQPTGYSDAEISSAAASLVQSKVAVKRDSLGPVDLEAQFQEVVDLVTTTLANDPNAVFYLLYLMASTTSDQIETLTSTLEDLLKAVREIAGPIRPITDTALLGDAAAALLEVNAILSRDDTIQKASYDRFVKAVDQFRDISLRPNIAPTSDGVSRSHPEAVKVAYDQLAVLRTAYPELFEKMKGLGTYLDRFMTLELRKASAQTSIDSARQSLTGLQATFEDPNTNDVQKVMQARSSYLALAAAKAVVGGIHLQRDPRAAKLEATPGSGVKLFKNVPVLNYDQTNAPFRVQGAVAVAKNGGPWRLAAGTNQLVVSANGRDPVTFSLPIPEAPEILSDGASSTYMLTNITTARLVSTIADTYTIPAAPDNNLQLIVNGILYSGDLTEGTRSLADVIDEIEAITGLTGVLTVDSDESGHLTLETIATGSTAGILVKELADALGFSDTNSFASGTDYNRTLVIDRDHFVELPAGEVATTDIANAITEAFPGEYTATVHEDGKRIYLSRVDGYLKFAMTLPPVGGSFGPYTYDLLARCYSLLGFYDGQTGYTPPTTAADIADLLNASAAFRDMGAVASVSRDVIGTVMGADQVISMQGLACSYPNPLQLSFPAADVESGFLFNYLAAAPYLLSAEIKSGYNKSVCCITSAALQEDGSMLATIDPEFPLRLTEDTSAYAIVKDTLKIVSTGWEEQGLTSKLSISGSAATLFGIAGDYYGYTNGVVFFPESLTVPAQDSTQFFALALQLGGYGLSKGDLLWQPNNDYSGVLGTTLFNVAGTLANADVEYAAENGKLLVLDLPGVSLRPATPPDPGWVVYSYEAFYYRYFINRVYPVSFVQFLHNAWVKPYASGSTAELERILNPLLVNPQPSVAQINDAETAVEHLLFTVTGFASVCAAVLSRRVDRIDAALSMLKERGFDLAYQALSAGDLIGFLAMDKDDASSSGAMLKAAREVVQNDVPVSKTLDDADVERTHLTTAYSPDAAYNYDDADQVDAATLVGEGVVVDSDDPAADQVTGKTVSG